LGRVKSAVGSPFNPSLLSEDIRSIFGLGFFDDVQTRVEDFEGGVKVTFVVSERPFVRDVDFVGNKALKTTELQDKVDIKLGSVYNPVDVQRAVEKLRDFYEDEGYFEVQLTPNVEKFPDGDVRVVFNLVEGRQIKIDRIRFTGNKGLTDRELKAALATQERQYFILRGKVQRQRLEEDVERIIQLYNDHGYIQARVESTDVAVDREKARVTITFTIDEGAEVCVERINISGNVRSQDKILRREIPLHEGDLYTLQKKERARQKLVNLGYFEKVEVNTQPGSDKTRIIVNVEVTERPTGIFSLGGGFSSVDSFVGTIDLAQRNFLGRGWEASVRLRGGGRTQQGVISFTDPWLFDRPLSGGFDLYSNDRQYIEYRYRSLGAGLRLGRPFFEYWRWNLGYRASNDKISNLSEV